MPVTGNNHIRYNLSIRVTADGFSFFVTDAATGDLMHREDAPLQEACSPTLQTYTFDQVRAIVDADATSVPLDELDESRLAETYKGVYCRADLTHSTVCAAPVEALQMAEVFPVETTVREAILKAYPEAIFTCVQANILERIARFCSHHVFSKSPLFVYVQKDKIHIFNVANQQLLFANSFKAADVQTALFFLLSVWKELDFDAKENPCYISGDKALAQPLTDKAANYILNVDRLGSSDASL